jgi:hypothetical protein
MTTKDETIAALLERVERLETSQGLGGATLESIDRSLKGLALRADDGTAKLEAWDQGQRKTHQTLQSERKLFAARLETTIELGHLGLTDVRFTATGYVGCRLDPRPGDRFVQGVPGGEIDMAHGERLIRAELISIIENDLDAARRAGDKTREQDLLAKIEAPEGIGPGRHGVKQQRMTLIMLPVLRRVVGKYLEDVIASGLVRLVETPAATSAAAE